MPSPPWRGINKSVRLNLYAASPVLAASAAAFCMPVELSPVTAFCSSTAVAVDVAYSLTFGGWFFLKYEHFQ
jgi:hypothetical protein